MVLNEQSMTKTDLNPKELTPLYKLKLLRSRAKNGLLLLTFQNILMRLGFDIDPFVVTQEKLDYCKKPNLKENANLYSFRTLSAKEIENHYLLIGMDSCALEVLLTSNHTAFGLFYQNQLAAYMMARFENYEFKSKGFWLEEDEAYMCGAYTYHDFRGKGLAPYLRFKCYEVLSEQGISKFVSITQYFNRPSLKYKAKLNAKYKNIYLYLEFFHKFNWLFKLKNYTITE